VGSTSPPERRADQLGQQRAHRRRRAGLLDPRQLGVRPEPAACLVHGRDLPLDQVPCVRERGRLGDHDARARAPHLPAGDHAADPQRGHHEPPELASELLELPESLDTLPL
jgi:hypothetical protein